MFFINILKIYKMYKTYHQGKYKVINKEKYIGNIDNVIFRSSWEKRFMLFVDNCNLIQKWSSEDKNCIVPYRSIDGKVHRYFVDFYIKLSNGKEFLIEIKPHKETKPASKKSKNYLNESLKYVKNSLKWEAADKIAKDKGMQFLVITEKILKPEFSDKKLLENLSQVLGF